MIDRKFFGLKPTFKTPPEIMMFDAPISKNLLWIDLEMTGLDPDQDRIIEVAALVTDFDFKEIDSYQAVIKQDAGVLERMDSWAEAPPAWLKLKKEATGGVPEAKAEQELLALVDKHFEQPAILAGNSVYFDRRFMRRAWPRLEAKLHYRMLDVTAWKVVMQAKYKHVFASQEAHRAMDDVRSSIAELKDYLKFLGK